jgi:hypothetical protein
VPATILPFPRRTDQQELSMNMRMLQGAFVAAMIIAGVMLLNNMSGQMLSTAFTPRAAA